MTENEIIPVKKSAGVANTNISDKTRAAIPQKKKPEPRQFKSSDEFYVVSNVDGELHWESKKTGAKATWKDFGKGIMMTVADIADMRYGYPSFFENNWVYVDDKDAEQLYRYLRVDEYYSDSISKKGMDSVFLQSPEEISMFLSKQGAAKKDLIACRAAKLYRLGIITDTRVIKVIETATGVDITELD